MRRSGDRVEGLLMSEYRLTEPEALPWIRRGAIDHRATMNVIATTEIALVWLSETVARPSRVRLLPYNDSWVTSSSRQATSRAGSATVGITV